MAVINDANFNEQISNNESKPTYENGEIGSATMKQKSLFTISGVNFYSFKLTTNFFKNYFSSSKTNFNVNAIPFVSRRETSTKKIENIFKMSAPVPHIDPMPHGRNFQSNPDVRNWRSSSAHIRHFDQSQSFDGYERRPVGFNIDVLICSLIFTTFATGILSIFVARSSKQLR